MSDDATPAYRGYRLQALYALFKILEISNNTIYQPEGKEDLAIFQDNILTEIIQVKAYSDDLKLSNFKDSFFLRVASAINNNSNIRIKIVSFGIIGPELLRGFNENGKDRDSVFIKIKERTNLNDDLINKIIENIDLIEVNEDEMFKCIYEKIHETFLGFDVKNAFDTIQYWLYVSSEEKRKITYKDVVTKLNNIGKFLSDRHDFHNEWFSTITPIEDYEIMSIKREKLSEEFYHGVSARYEHILADVDILRYNKLIEINDKYNNSNVLIIHGVSGQGKTTLAYRYLREYFSDLWRFQINCVDNRSHALRIANVLISHAEAIDVPIGVYIDVSARDEDWTELVKQLSIHKNIRILITIREEDWKRASVSGNDFQYSTMELNFLKDEAENIYKLLIKNKIPDNLLNFEDAWNKFGREGPLMEFIYLVSYGSSLQDRLNQQITRIEDEIRNGKCSTNELELLRLVSIASTYEAQLDVISLIETLKISAPQRVFDLYEKEYLLRVSEDGKLVRGLHPIRSEILSKILTDPTISPWSKSANVCLPLIFEPDLEKFLLYSFSRQSDADISSLLVSLYLYKPKTWTGIAGIVRSLIWLGLKQYIKTNQELIDEAYSKIGLSFTIVLDYDISNAMPNTNTTWWDDLSNIVPSERRDIFNSYRSKQSDKNQVFINVKSWVSTFNYKPNKPLNDSDWSGLAETMFWMDHLKINYILNDYIEISDLDKAIDVLSIDILADLIFGLSNSSSELKIWLESNKLKIKSKLRVDQNIMLLEDHNNTLKAHFIIDFNTLNRKKSVKSGDILHDITINLLKLLRKLFPYYNSYSCQGYGHRHLMKDVFYDPTEKVELKPDVLPPDWLISINSTFEGLLRIPYRPKTWKEYFENIYTSRNENIHFFKQINNGLLQYFKKKTPIQFPLYYVNMDEFITAKNNLMITQQLPLCSVDEWGFNSEFTKEINKHSMMQNNVSVYETEKFLNSLNNYTSSLNNYFSQSTNIMRFYPLVGRSFKTKSQINIKDDDIRLSILNISNFLNGLSEFQFESRWVFNQFINNDELYDLEKNEYDVYNATFKLWCCFCLYPNLLFRNPLKDSDIKISWRFKNFKNNIMKDFNIDSNLTKLSIISTNMLWKQKPTLWLLIESDNLIDLYNSQNLLLASIKQDLTKYNNIEYFNILLDTYYYYIVIVPIIKGQNLFSTVWVVRPSILLMEDNYTKFKISKITEEPILKESLTELNIDLYKDPKLKLIIELSLSIFLMSSILQVIKDYSELPEIDNDGLEILKSNIEIVSSQLSASLQKYINSAAKLLDAFNRIPPSELESHMGFVNAIQVLINMNKIVIPETTTNDNKIDVSMNTESIIKWSKKFEEIYPLLIHLQSYYISEIL